MGGRPSRAQHQFVSSIPFGVWRIVLQVVAVSFSVLWTVAPVHTQGRWSAPEELSEPQDGWQDIGATMVADQSGLVHLAWAREPGDVSMGPPVFYYARWDGTRWTPPVDILAANDARRLGRPVLVATPDGWLDIFWNTGSFLYRSRAWAASADSAPSWKTPDIVIACDYACSVPMDVVLDEDGVFHIVYTRRIGEVYYIRSDDRGSNWSSPVAVSPMVAPDTTTYLPKLAVATDGRIHVVWTEQQLPNGPALRVMYAHSRDGGRTWSTPLELGGRFHNDGNVVTVGSDIVYLAWNGGIGAGGGRYFRWSGDGGATWTPTSRFSARAGWAGYPSMALDSASVLHILTGEGEYRAWDGQVWFPPTRLPPADINIEQARLAVVGGNQVLAIWSLNFEGMYFAHRQLDAPSVPTLLPPTPTPMLLTTATPAIAPTSARSSHTPVQEDDVSSFSQVSATLPIVVSAGLSLVVVAIGACLYAWFRRR